MSITLSRYVSPLTSSQGAGVCLAPLSLMEAVLNNVSIVSVDLPPPETPVTHVKVANGKDALMPFKLFPVAFVICIFLPLPFRLLEGMSIFREPLKY